MGAARIVRVRVNHPPIRTARRGCSTRTGGRCQKPQQLIVADELELHLRMQRLQRPDDAALARPGFQNPVAGFFQPFQKGMVFRGWHCR